MRIVYGLAAALVAVPLAIATYAQAPAADLKVATTSVPGAARDRYWPQWRGPLANGVSRTANPPLDWSETRNVRWKVEIPGRGSASPVVWGDRVFVLTAIPAGTSVPESHAPRGGVNPRGVLRYVVMALDRRDGKI